MLGLCHQHTRGTQSCRTKHKRCWTIVFAYFCFLFCYVVCVELDQGVARPRSPGKVATCNETTQPCIIYVKKTCFWVKEKGLKPKNAKQLFVQQILKNPENSSFRTCKGGFGGYTTNLTEFVAESRLNDAGDVWRTTQIWELWWLGWCDFPWHRPDNGDDDGWCDFTWAVGISYPVHTQCSVHTYGVSTPSKLLDGDFFGVPLFRVNE